jgi:hypothetical protein
MTVQRFSGENMMHNHDADSEACITRQILNNSLKRKAMEDLCERPRKLIQEELRSQYLDTLTYNDIRNISIKHGPPNYFLSQHIMKKLMKHEVLYQC